MQNVPKIVRERLRAATPAVNHPDAGVLAAFTERSLPELERAIVVEHLAGCRDCRDIVALALPVTEAAEAIASPAGRRWLTWPALRWGLAAVGIAAVAWLGVVQHQRQSHPAMMVAKESSREKIATYAPSQAPRAERAQTTEPKTSFDASKTAANPPSIRMAAKLAEPKLMRKAVGQTPESSNEVGPIGGPLAYGPKMPAQWQQQSTATQAKNFNPPIAAPSAGAKQAVDAYPANIPQSAEVSRAQAPLESAPAQLQVAQSAPNQPSEQLFDRPAPGPVKAKPAVTEIRGVKVANLIPRWSINAAGGLERSFDQGNSWQEVDVNSNATPATGLTRLAVARTAPADQESRNQQESANKKAPTPPLAAPVFTAVAANGAEVWAGGASGALYHSLDAGNHWTRVVPSAAGVTLSGDVVRLEFSDAQHGKITTSSGEIWTTSDDGQSWLKQ